MAFAADATRLERDPLMKRISQSSENMPVLQSTLAPKPVSTRVDAKVRQLKDSLQRGALIQSLAPENEVQAALAIDASLLHAAATNVLDRLGPSGGDRRLVMLETYYRIKRGNTQVIRVEKLEVQASGQALVGSLQRT